MEKVIVIIISLLVLREILASVFRWEAGWFGELLADRKHNAAIKRQYGKSAPHPDDIIATDYMDAIRKAGREGLTIEGDVYKTMTHVGKNRWRAGTEKFKK